MRGKERGAGAPLKRDTLYFDIYQRVLQSRTWLGLGVLASVSSRASIFVVHSSISPSERFRCSLAAFWCPLASSMVNHIFWEW